jgi:uncharacterized membrane protein
MMKSVARAIAKPCSLLAAYALLVGGCGTSPKTAPVVRNAPAAAEQRVVEIVDRSPTDLRDAVAQWQQQGWSVVSVSARLRQADGTARRKILLTRPRHDSALEK